MIIHSIIEFEEIKIKGNIIESIEQFLLNISLNFQPEWEREYDINITKQDYQLVKKSLIAGHGKYLKKGSTKKSLASSSGIKLSFMFK